MQESDGSEDGQLEFLIIKAGSQRSAMMLDRVETVFNQDSQDIDFRIESNTNTHAIFVEGSSSNIGINTSSPQSDLHITGSDTSTSVIIENTNADAAAAPDLFLFRNSSSPADDDNLGNIEFRGKNDNAEDTRYVINNVKALDVSDGTEDGQIEWQLLNAGSFQKILTMNPTEVVINEDSGSTDFRVESNGQANAFKIDGGADTASFAVPVDIDAGVTIDNITIDGTEIDLSSGDLLVDVAGDITLDAGGGNVKVAVGGTDILDIANSSSDVIIKPVVDAKDLIFQQRDGTEVARIEDNATFNVSVAGKFAYAGTAVTSTAAELNILDGVTSTAAELNIIDGDTSATSTTIADADRIVLNDNGTMVQAAMTDVKTYIGGGTSWQAIKTGNFTAEAGQGVFANTTSSAFTVTLPASPSLGDEVTIVDYAGTFDSNSLTVGRNSQPIQGVAEDLVVSTERASFTLVYVDSTQGWLFKND
jgi:hypothetical protein